MLTYDYHVNRNSIHVCFPIKIKKKTNAALDIDGDIITANNFFAHWVKEISVTKYGSDKQLPSTFFPWVVYQYSDAMLKYLLSDALKTIAKTLLYDKQPVYFVDRSYARRNHDAANTDLTGLNAARQAAKRLKYWQKDSSVSRTIKK